MHAINVGEQRKICAARIATGRPVNDQLKVEFRQMSLSPSLNMKKELIVAKSGLFPKAVYIARTGNDRHIIKESICCNANEYSAFALMESLGISYHFARIERPQQTPTGTVTVIEYIDEDVGSILARLPEDKRPHFWHRIVGQLASVVNVLEQHEIQHNDFTPANLRVCLRRSEDFTIKIIDLETMVDYRNRRLYPLEIIDAPPSEQVRMGWSRTFHVGSDLNQMLGELIHLYARFMPEALMSDLAGCIVERPKEFPYAICDSNAKTSGKAILRLLTRLSPRPDQSPNHG